MDEHFESLMDQVKVINDRVRGVVHRRSNGFYLHGRPGTSKSYMVCSTLDRLRVPYEFSNGHLTPIGLFDLIEQNRTRVIVLDDVVALFNQPIALQILLAALGNRHDQTGIRIVRYKTAKGDQIVHFEGGIICISNLPLAGHHEAILRALHDRVYVVHYDPTDDQMIAMIHDIAAKGIDGVSPKDAKMVATFLVTECRKREVRPTIRLFVDKAIKDYDLWKSGQTETHWKDLLVSNLEQQLVNLVHPTKDLSRAEQTEAERRIAKEILGSNDDSKSKVRAWQEQTGKSQAAFYRRVAELKKAGLLSSEVV
jgi:hypothetical protein